MLNGITKFLRAAGLGPGVQHGAQRAAQFGRHVAKHPAHGVKFAPIGAVWYCCSGWVVAHRLIGDGRLAGHDQAAYSELICRARGRGGVIDRIDGNAEVVSDSLGALALGGPNVTRADLVQRSLKAGRAHVSGYARGAACSVNEQANEVVGLHL